MSRTANQVVRVCALLAVSALATTAVGEQVDGKRKLRSPATIRPDAVGFGRWCWGGGGRNSAQPAGLYRIYSLADSGKGSLREAVDAEGPRIVVIGTTGLLELDSPLEIKNPFITLVAPPGFYIEDAGIFVMTHDVYLESLCLLIGDQNSERNKGDGLRIFGRSTDPSRDDCVYNVYINRCAVGWSWDENFSINGPVTWVSVNNTVIFEGLTNSVHAENKDHSMGFLINPGARQISAHGNALFRNGVRNPRVQAVRELIWTNNVVRGWGPKAFAAGDFSDTRNTGVVSRLWLQGNRYLPEAYSYKGAPFKVHPSREKVPMAMKVVVKDNLGPGRTSSDDSNSAITENFEPGWFVDAKDAASMFTVPSKLGIEPVSADKALEYVETHAGPWPRSRSANVVVSRVMKQLRDGGSKSLLDAASDELKFPKAPARRLELSPPSAPERDRLGADGRTGLERWALNPYGQ